MLKKEQFDELRQWLAEKVSQHSKNSAEASRGAWSEAKARDQCYENGMEQAYRMAFAKLKELELTGQSAKKK